jgi:hypothetical protein
MGHSDPVESKPAGHLPCTGIKLSQRYSRFYYGNKNDTAEAYFTGIKPSQRYSRCYCDNKNDTAEAYFTGIKPSQRYSRYSGRNGISAPSRKNALF